MVGTEHLDLQAPGETDLAIVFAFVRSQLKSPKTCRRLHEMAAEPPVHWRWRIQWTGPKDMQCLMRCGDVQAQTKASADFEADEADDEPAASRECGMWLRGGTGARPNRDAVRHRRPSLPKRNAGAF